MAYPIRFDRNIPLAWLDEAAALRAAGADEAALRAHLLPIAAGALASRDNQLKIVAILQRVWAVDGPDADLRQAAVARYPALAGSPDRLWLHYGLTLLTYPFFRRAAAVVGQLTRHGGEVGKRRVSRRLMDELGQLPSLPNAAMRVLVTLREWGILLPGGHRWQCRPAPPRSASDQREERWLLAVALRVHPAEELPFADLPRLPELFPFAFTVGIDALRRDGRFAIQRQGGGWEMVREARGDGREYSLTPNPSPAVGRGEHDVAHRLPLSRARERGSGGEGESS